VERIQAAAEQNMHVSQPEFKLIKNIPRNALLNPIDAEQRIGNQRFSLGDRIVYVLNSGRVPIAQRGTVVGITRLSRQTWLDVAFDTTYMGGTTLGDRCKPFSGSTVPSDSVLNLTDKQVVAMSAASSARRPPPVIQPIDQRTYGAPTGPQLRPAAVPPPLHGSFSVAVAGQQPYGGRGRGRGARAGFANGANGPPRGGRGGRGGSNNNGWTEVGPSNRAGFKPRGRGFAGGNPPANANGGGARGGRGAENAAPAPRGGRGGRGRGRDASAEAQG